MNQRVRALSGLALGLAVLLSACDGDDDAPEVPAARGTLLTAQKVGATATRASIDSAAATQGVATIATAAVCDVEVRRITYMTRDPAGQPATASAGVFVPSGTGPACSGERPVLLYGHGTSTDKAYDISQVDKQPEGALLMAFHAAQGFIVVAPNYLGYDGSSLGYTPYLNAEASAVDMIDGLRAAKAHLASAAGTKPSAKLLIAGYSQGGHVAMATQKVIERDHGTEFTVTASGPMSGPYSLVNMADIITIGTDNTRVNAGATLFLPMLLTSYQKAYGDVYARPSDVYQAPFDTSAEGLLPSTQPVADLMAQGKLPNDPSFRRLFGTGGLLTDTFRAAYPTSRYRAALQANTLLDWTPAAPVALCGGAGDPTVYFSSTTDAQSAFASRGKQVPAYNLENRASLPAGAAGDPVYGGFAQAKADVAAAGGGGSAGAAAVQAAYHGSLVPPFCHALVRGFFQSVLAATP